MLAKALTVAFVGPEARVVDVEVHVFSTGLPGLAVVGLAGKAIKEAEHRIRSALEGSGPQWPNRKIVANLAPSGLRKEGTHFDLGLALGILAGDGQLPPQCLDRRLVVGELALDGSLRPVPGVLAAAIACKEHGLLGIICPRANASEAALIPELEVWGAVDLDHVVGLLRGTCEPDPPPPPRPRRDGSAPDLAEVRGHEDAKRALEIAAAGGHNLLMSGPPGCGKTMLATRLGGILPLMTEEESLEVSRIHSIAGLLGDEAGLIAERPFRSPHHHVSVAGLIGGGTTLARPGEVTLAHRGTLFLDELPLFSRHILESLRAPLEEGRVRLARSGGVVTYPCRFALLAALNPCPCGYHLDDRRSCTCHPSDRQRYRQKLSGPLLDRFDILIGMRRPSREELLGASTRGSSDEVRERVAAAVLKQSERFGPGVTNASVPRPGLRRALHLEAPAAGLLASAVDSGILSARGVDKVLRVALTISDLAGTRVVDEPALAEALSLRVSAWDLGEAA